MNLPRALLLTIDETIYHTLFGMSGAQLREYVGLRPRASQDELMDHMGLHAIDAISRVERRCTSVMPRLERVSRDEGSFDYLLNYVKVEAASVREIYAAKAAAEGSDFVTGFPLEGRV